MWRRPGPTKSKRACHPSEISQNDSDQGKAQFKAAAGTRLECHPPPHEDMESSSHHVTSHLITQKYTRRPLQQVPVPISTHVPVLVLMARLEESSSPTRSPHDALAAPSK